MFFFQAATVATVIQLSWKFRQIDECRGLLSDQTSIHANISCLRWYLNIEKAWAFSFTDSMSSFVFQLE